MTSGEQHGHTSSRRRVKEWVTDAVHMANTRKVVIASTGRDLRFFDITSGHYVEEHHLFGGLIALGASMLRVLQSFFSTRTSDRAQIWHACADRYSQLNFFLTHPTPGGFRGLSIVKHLSRRTAPKFCTHVRIDTLILIIFFLPTPPQGG